MAKAVLSTLHFVLLDYFLSLFPTVQKYSTSVNIITEIHDLFVRKMNFRFATFFLKQPFLRDERFTVLLDFCQCVQVRFMNADVLPLITI